MLRSSTTILSLLIASAVASHVCFDTPCATFNVEADIVFVVDSSNAIDSSSFEQVRSFLYSFINGLTVSTIDTQVSIYAYGSNVQNVIGLADGSNIENLRKSINSTLKYQGQDNRNLYDALVQLSRDVNPSNGLRPSYYKKVLVVMSADSWTGNEVIGSAVLRKVQGMFDVILTVGVGSKSVKNMNQKLSSLSKVKTNTFYATSLDQLPLASAWISGLSCPGIQITTTAPMPTTVPTQAPSVPCSLRSLSYNVYLIVDVSNAASPDQFSQMKQTIINYVSEFDSKTQFALITTGMDSQFYYTSFHSEQKISDVIFTIKNLVQDDVAGQTLDMAIHAIQPLLTQYPNTNSLMTYFTSTTAWDKDPSSTLNEYKNKFGLKSLAIPISSNANSDNLSKLFGNGCVYDSNNSQTSDIWLETKMCSNNFC